MELNMMLQYGEKRNIHGGEYFMEALYINY